MSKKWTFKKADLFADQPPKKLICSLTSAKKGDFFVGQPKKANLFRWPAQQKVVQNIKTIWKLASDEIIILLIVSHPRLF